jgi:two-component system alkaline phosphatase synthesis response regulator PhoP
MVPNTRDGVDSTSHDARPRGRGPLVLVIEDTSDLRDLFAAELATDGFMVISAEDGESGIDKARRFTPDAIVLDLMLPAINGFNVARILRNDPATENTAILAVTALTSERLRNLAIEAGCDACLSKPVLSAKIVAELLRLLARRRNAADLSRLRF